MPGGLLRTDAKWAFYDAIDNITDRDGLSTWDAGDFKSGVVATTCLLGVKNDLREADVCFNTHDFDFTNKPTRSCSNKYDIRSVGTHEVGHVFGLEHVGSGHENLTMHTTAFNVRRKPGRSVRETSSVFVASTEERLDLMSWVGRTTALLAAVMVSAVSCTAVGSSSGGGEESGSCEYRILYQDRTYRDVANVEFIVGVKLGDAIKPPCDDTGGQGTSETSGTTETVYEIDGISPKVAVAVGDTPDEARFVAAYSGTKLPPEVKKLIDGS